MKVKIEYVVDVDEVIREGIRLQYGREGLATHAEVKRWYEDYGTSLDEELWQDAEAAARSREMES